MIDEYFYNFALQTNSDQCWIWIRDSLEMGGSSVDRLQVFLSCCWKRIIIALVALTRSRGSREELPSQGGQMAKFQSLKSFK